ncbi:MAG: MOSC domain-containing protein [Pseudomonadota bacterium]
MTGKKTRRPLSCWKKEIGEEKRPPHTPAVSFSDGTDLFGKDHTSMKLLSVNVGKAEPIATKSGLSGIFKRPQLEPVLVGKLGLAGDMICDTENHGGIDQAVYVFGSPDYDWWSAELGQRLEPGTFGENLTIGELASTDIHIGDRLVINDVVLEVTAPRIPCVTLSARMNDRLFAKRFLKAERPGAYCRVIEEGWVKAGTDVTFQAYQGDRLALIESFRIFNKSGS